MESASVNILRLRDELLAEVREAFPADGSTMPQLVACVSELESTAQVPRFGCVCVRVCVRDILIYEGLK